MKYSVLLLAVLSIFASVSYADSGNLNLFAGTKQMNENDWEPVDDHGELGIMFNYTQANWPVSVAAGLLGSYADETEDGIDMEVETREACVGVIRIWEPANTSLRPYIGAGVALIRADGDLDNEILYFEDSDSGVGFWLSGGAYLTISEHFNLGFMCRYSEAEVTLFNSDMKAGGAHIGVLVGYHF